MLMRLAHTDNLHVLEFMYDLNLEIANSKFHLMEIIFPSPKLWPGMY
jgi:hypothetical protein